MPRARIPWAARLSLAVVAVLTGGCIQWSSIGRSLGGGIVQGARGRQATLDSLARGVVIAAGQGVDSMRDHLSRAVDVLGAQVAARLDTTLDSVEQRAKRMEDTLGAFLDGPARERLARLLSSNIALVRGDVRAAIEEWAAALDTAIDSSLGPSLRGTTAGLVDTATLRLAMSLDTSGALAGQLVAISDRIVRQAVRSLAEESANQETPRWAWFLAAGLVLIVAAVVGRFVLALKRELRNRELSMNLMGYTIQESRDPLLADRVRGLAQQHGVENYLHGYLAERRLLQATPPR